MIIKEEIPLSRAHEVVNHLINLQKGKKHFALLPKKLDSGQTVWLGNYYTYPIGLYFNYRESRKAYHLSRYIYGGWEDAGYCYYFSLKPNDVNAVEIEVDGKKIKGQAALDWFLENLDKIY